MDFISLKIKVCYFAKSFVILFTFPAVSMRIKHIEQLQDSSWCNPRMAIMDTYLSYQWVELGSCTHKLKTGFSGGQFAIGSIKPLSGSPALLEDVGLYKVVKSDRV